MSKLVRNSNALSNVSRLCLIGVVAGLMSGCAALKRDHIEVGAIPDDYRTRHPITITENEQYVDIPITSTASQLTVPQKGAVRGLVDNYNANGSGPIRIMVPSGSTNHRAANRLASDIVRTMKSANVKSNAIYTETYDGSGHDKAAPIRITYNALVASTNQCGQWKQDILAERDQNKNYANFGCAIQSNIAAQVANPADLLGPRAQGPIDAERRTQVIGNWRESGSSGDFSENTNF